MLIKFILANICIILTQSYNVTIKLEQNFTVSLSLGITEKSVSLPIRQDYEHTIVNTKLSTSECFSQNKIQVGKFSAIGSLFLERVILDSKDILLSNSYGFYKISNDTNLDGLAFSYKIDSRTSLIHLLFELEMIDRLSYTIADSPPRFLCMGKCDNYTKLGSFDILDGKGNCSVEREHTTWGCSLEKIIIKSGYQEKVFHPIQGYASFQVNENLIVVSEEFFTFFIENFLKEDFSSNNCHTQEKGPNSGRIKCFKLSKITKETKMKFFFKDILFEFPLERLFINYNLNFYYTLFRRSNSTGDEFIFGEPFFRNFLTTFDYENSTISFISNRKVKIINRTFEDDALKQIKEIRGKLILILILILFFSTFLVSYMKFYSIK